MVNRVRHNACNTTHMPGIGTAFSVSLPLFLSPFLLLFSLSLFLSPFSLPPAPSLVPEGQHIENLCWCCCCCCNLVRWVRTVMFLQGLGSSFLLIRDHRGRLMQEDCNSRRCVNYSSSSGHREITCFLVVFCEWRS